MLRNLVARYREWRRAARLRRLSAPDADKLIREARRGARENAAQYGENQYPGQY
ncbi:MAG TPA: hypothetical protein VF895_02380 [Gaiellaceae bacterium]